MFAVSCSLYQPAEQSALQEVLDYRDVRGMEESSMEYPMETEKKILSALRAANEEAAEKACRLFMDQLLRGNPEIAQLYILKFCVPLSELFAGEGIRNLDFYHIKKELENRETLYEKQAYLDLLFSGFVSEKLEQKRRKEREVAENAMDWIREHYQDGNMTLDTIAEAQGCSSSYLRRIFREVKETSPTDYLMEVRLDRAKELLLSTGKIWDSGWS